MGLVIKMPAAATIEMAGHSGFDLVVVDTEHGPADVIELEHHLRAAESAGVACLVRVGSGEPSAILHALDAGADGVIVPRVIDVAAVERAVAAAHYPPVGRRGLAVSTRAGRHGLADVAEHVREAIDKTVVVVQIEDAEAVEQVAAIASSAHLDAVFVGPTDLSISLGYPGEITHSVVAAAIDQVADGVLAEEGAKLCVLVSDDVAAREWRARGARILLFSAASLFSDRLRGLVLQLKPGLPGSVTPPLTDGLAPHTRTR